MLSNMRTQRSEGEGKGLTWGLIESARLVIFTYSLSKAVRVNAGIVHKSPRANTRLSPAEIGGESSEDKAYIDVSITVEH